MQKPVRDIEKDYPLPKFIEKLRRLAMRLRMVNVSRSRSPDRESRFPCERITTSRMSAVTTRKRSSFKSRGT